MPAEPAVPPSAPPRRAPPGLALFAAALAEHLGVDAIDDLDSVLALAGTAAHEVVRPAAPVAAYLLGAAVATSPGQPVAAIAAEIETFIRTWAESSEPR
ncbi:MAG TPA: DUF6457 domain-containing protein [Actinopolymorphaceae bacterium]|jgi:hypothetical protein